MQFLIQNELLIKYQIYWIPVSIPIQFIFILLIIIFKNKNMQKNINIWILEVSFNNIYLILLGIWYKLSCLCHCSQPDGYFWIALQRIEPWRKRCLLPLHYQLLNLLQSPRQLLHPDDLIQLWILPFKSALRLLLINIIKIYVRKDRSISEEILVSASLPAPTPTTTTSPTTSSGWLCLKQDEIINYFSRLPLPLSPLELFPPASFTSSREAGSLLARAP